MAAATVRRIGIAAILRWIVAFAIGILIGLMAYTFVYAKGFSYLSNDPQACVNCHVMEDQYESWQAGHHRHTATCGDCHLPHDNIVHKYWVKAEDGFHHGLKFTTGDYPENIVIRDVNMDVANEACVHCHADVTDDMRHGALNRNEVYDCVHCHSGIGHE